MASRVSIVMAVYNDAKYLGEATESILSQTFSDFEFLIIDDGSTDATPELLSGYNQQDERIQWYRFEHNRGLAAALNYGIHWASGEYIARMDADDISLPERLAVQVDYMDANPEIGICGAWVELIGNIEGQVWELPSKHDSIFAQMLFSNALAHPSVVMRAQALKQHNLQYDEHVHYAQDYELWSRAIFRTKLANVPQILVQHRRHARSTGDQHHQAQLQTHEVVARRLLAPFELGETADEIRLHCKIGVYQYGGGRQFLRKTRNWLMKLSVANHVSGIIPPAMMDAELGKYWTLACLRSGAHPMIVLTQIASTRLPFCGKVGFSKMVAVLPTLFTRLSHYFQRARIVE